MSTQDESGITFEISNSQKSFRLLELPPTLLGLITSKQLPKYDLLSMSNSSNPADMLESLTLKSTVPNSIEDSTQNPPSVVLCTDNQTYQVRQVQSSNSVFVLKASETVSDADAIPSPSISAIAKCTATLELIPATPSAAHFLRTSIPIYRGAESSSQNAVASGISSNTSRTALLEKAPFSSGEYDRKCKELCIFEESSQVWLPPSSVLISVWKSMLSAASLKSFNLAESFSVSALEGIIEEDGHSVAVLKAIVERLGSDHENDLMDGCKSIRLLHREIRSSQAYRCRLK